MAWAAHQDLIPNEVSCAVSEPEEQLASLPPLFLHEEEIIRSTRS
jgi:hypothetical protein